MLLRRTLVSQLLLAVGFVVSASLVTLADDQKDQTDSNNAAEVTIPQDQSADGKSPAADAKSGANDSTPANTQPQPEKETKPDAGDPKVDADKGTKEPAAEKPAEQSSEKPQEPPAPAPIFPDQALEAVVRAVVFEKRFNQEPLTKEDVAKIPHVIGRGKGIKSLEGLQHCVSLMKIDLENNEISDLKPIAGLTKMISLSLAGNQVKEIGSLQQLTNLQLLDLSRNQIKSLDAVSKMLNLRDLWVADNMISDLKPIADLPKIWYLDIARNQVADLSVVGKLKWLTTLDVTQNQVTNLTPLASLKDLDLLLVSKNQITDFGPVVEMCVADAGGERRFAPYLEIYLGENPLNASKKAEWFEKLKDAGVDVFEK
jgi:hypothetical protein